MSTPEVHLDSYPVTQAVNPLWTHPNPYVVQIGNHLFHKDEIPKGLRHTDQRRDKEVLDNLKNRYLRQKYGDWTTARGRQITYAPPETPFRAPLPVREKGHPVLVEYIPSPVLTVPQPVAQPVAQPTLVQQPAPQVAPTYSAPAFAAPLESTFLAPTFAAPTYAAPTLMAASNYPTFAGPTFSGSSFPQATFTEPAAFAPATFTQPTFALS
eukprot:NODE_4490_length_800_cov_361.147803_g4152_i0.p1 GENE.NODE_4490_length_800_cov_361.147803_g4152_i0~~NODE_4490_length_800_cov_361.147803_g4152_i0.p1  ORF type:complete len:211 (-),score=23.89 NODE_4490_length_800_cov_361.147803_g4152_i0:95-727(-)